jgi:predicted dehydrogenase
VRVLQVGLGVWGKGWANLVRASAEVELVAVVDSSPEALAWAVGELGIEARSCYSSLRQAAAAVDCDAMLIATPPETHRALAEVALGAGKHVLVEKPLATTLQDAQELVELGRRADVSIVVGQNYRFSPAARAIKRLMSDGSLGAIVCVRIECRQDTRTVFGTGNFRYDMRHPYLQDMAIHHFDLIRAITGANARRVFARSWRVPGSPYAHHPAMAAIITLTNGAEVAYSGDWAAAGSMTSWSGRWEIIAARGRVAWSGGAHDLDPERVLVREWGGPVRALELLPTGIDGRLEILRQFRAAVVDGEVPETAAEDNLDSLAMVIACMRSIEEGSVVELPLSIGS